MCFRDGFGVPSKMGGVGCISVTANITPTVCALMHRAWDSGDLERFASIRDLLDPLHAGLFAESKLIPLRQRCAVWGSAAATYDCR
jgi:4-hydroxy-tetrahydrodipicolinate synthase